MRSATRAARNSIELRITEARILAKQHRQEPIASGTTAAATAAQTRYLSSPAAATLHGKTQGFVLRLPPHTHSPCNIHAAIPMRTTSLRHHFPSSQLPFVTTSLLHHFPSSPLPFIITSLSSPLPFVTTPLHSSLPFFIAPHISSFVTTSHRRLTTSRHHHFPSSPLPIVTTSLPHHFPSSPLPFVTTSLPHHFPSSPLPFVTTSLRHHFPSSPLPIVTTSHRHHLLSSPPSVIASLFYVMYHPSSRSIP